MSPPPSSQGAKSRETLQHLLVIGVKGPNPRANPKQCKVVWDHTSDQNETEEAETSGLLQPTVHGAVRETNRAARRDNDSTTSSTPTACRAAIRGKNQHRPQTHSQQQADYSSTTRLPSMLTAMDRRLLSLSSFMMVRTHS